MNRKFDSLERDQQLQQVQAEFPAVPWPDDEDLGDVDEKPYQKQRPANPVEERDSFS
jgi:hypothetical protein